MSVQAIRGGLDIAKRVFAFAAVNDREKIVIRKQLKRSEVLDFFAQLAPMEIGIETCGGSHYWGRELQKLGHRVKLIHARYVTPYRRKSKNDMNDAEAICEAISRPEMNFVAVKSEEQQMLLMIHRLRSQSIARRTAIINQLHGHLHEFGYVVSKGRHKMKRELREILSSDDFPALLSELVHDLLCALHREEERVDTYDKQIERLAKVDSVASKLINMEGVGALTATAVIASVGDPSVFKNGRQFAAWLGLVPKQYSSGGKQVLRGITKRGDVYLRTLLIHGARAVLLMANKERGKHCEWINRLRVSKPDNVVAVAFAAKQARMLWAVMMGKQPQPVL